MSKASILLAATTLVFGVSTVVLLHELRDARGREAALEARIAAIPAVEPRTGESEVHETAAMGATAATPPETDLRAARSTTSCADRTGAPVAARQDELDAGNQWLQQMKDPRYRAAMIARLRLQLERDNPDMARVLGLSAQEATAFMDLLAR
jgi:hypothetical protein